MERDNDVQLIRRILLGDDNAFNTLVQKHQKGVHALAWRKVGDFHIAEEITQDTFIQVYKNLAKLRNPNQFSGWLYVIANRLCISWLRKKKHPTQSLENTPVKVIDDAAYTHYESQQRESYASEQRHELVKSLLAKLPESERTVVTLYYLGEMTTRQIGKYLGVSTNTITSRLQRARKRLQEQQEENLIRETLGSIQIPADLTARIMEQVADINPTPTPVGKPLLPWAAFGTAMVLVLLMLGVSSQFLARFQKPYSFEAESEPTIEIIDATFVLDTPAKPTVRNQLGRATTPGETSSTGTQISDKTSASLTTQDTAQSSTTQWTQTGGPPSGTVRNIFAAADGTLLAISPIGMHKFAPDTNAWTPIKTAIKVDESPMPMAEHQDILYTVGADDLFTSIDRGETWISKGPRPKGRAMGILITDATQTHNPQTPATIYLALKDEGIFQSTDGGTQWTPFNNGFTNDIIAAIAAIEKTIFVGTNRGLYRLDSGIWKHLPVDDPSRSVYSLAGSENNLYVGTGPDRTGGPLPESGEPFPTSELNINRLFHSDDFGASWTDITPPLNIRGPYTQTGITILPAGDKILVLSKTQSLSTDGGKTWTQNGRGTNMDLIRSLQAAVGNETTFYKVGVFGLQRTTDAGNTWHFLMNGMAGTIVKNIIVFNNKFYAFTGYDVYQSTDEGQSWKKFSVEKPKDILDPNVPERHNAKWLVDGDSLYYIRSDRYSKLIVYRMSTDGDALIPIQDIPHFDNRKFGHLGNYKRLVPPLPPESNLKTTRVVVTNDVFFAEYKRRLLKWKIGDPAWTNTGFTDTSLIYDMDSRDGFKIAATGETVYVGKRNGKLFQSFDGANTWRDVTANLPLQFTLFKNIIFVGTTLYIATNNGVIVSQNDEHWHILTDSKGESPIINIFAVDGNKVYGIGDAGVYRLTIHGECKLISAEVPNRINTIAIANGKLYSGTDTSGLLHISLEDE